MATRASGGKWEILVIASDGHLREGVRHALEREDAEVVEAPDGSEALLEIQLSMPDLVLVDLAIVGVSGLDVCRYIRSRQTARQPPIIMLAAKGEEIDEVVGFELGATACLPKPFTTQELLGHVRAYLSAAPGDAAGVGPAMHRPAVRDHHPR